ncbi:hypothetical protein AB6A40_007493 [Gnathostoma spinigerum]|uniref:Uncharacterized protein n=1 Tax=Gnathostoma spinigerum TaxID=75299 RepID=A0ABD6ERI4_9BILA
MYGPTPVLADALHSRHKSISTYASGVLKNLQVDKPPVYQEELNTEIESALSRSENWMNDGFEPELFSEMYHPVGLDHMDNRSWRQPPSLYNVANPNPSWYDTDL